MRRPFARLAATCALAVATAIFTGTALAGGGQGNGNGNGNGATQSQQQPAAQQPTAQQQAPGQEKKAASTSGSSQQAGVKPSSTTSHWTTTHVGDSPDVSKRYGNGKTAAQIAASRGAPASQPLKGPGNSQPHKTYACGHKSNRSGGVDVHAIKSYSSTGCTTQTQPATHTEQPKQPEQPTEGNQKVTICHATGSDSNPYVEITVDEHALKEGHTTAKGDIIPAPAGGCPTTVAPVTPVVTPVAPVAPVTPATETPQTQAPVVVQQSQAPQTAVGALPATQSLPNAAAAPATGGVLGANTALATPKHHARGGVLGTVANVAGTSLPFTGFPVWLAVLIAIALILAGVTLRRRGTGARL